MSHPDISSGRRSDMRRQLSRRKDITDPSFNGLTWSLMLIGALLASAAPSIAPAQDCVVMSVDDYSGAPGDLVWISVDVSDLTGLGVEAAFVTLAYDGTLLTAVEVSLDETLAEGSFFVWNDQDLGGELRQVEIAIAGGEDFAGEGPLARILMAVDEQAEDGASSELTPGGYLNEGEPCLDFSPGLFTIPVSEITPNETPRRPQGLELRLERNPARETISFDVASDTRGPLRIDLYDSQGRRVLAVHGSRAALGGIERVMLPVGGLAGGNYWIVVTQGARRAATRVAIIN
ncbi:MAG: hypothetical protein GF355_09755 [Candidatus Eisenbacteria bacterium]|nr:hypothetical protein [Candidatus Eisenbacteria bacterium]